MGRRAATVLVTRMSVVAWARAITPAPTRKADRIEAIRTAEDRQRFKTAMTEIGLRVPPSGVAYAAEEALTIAAEVGYPVIVRPAYILGGGGTGIAHDHREMQHIAQILHVHRAEFLRVVVLV